MILGAAAQVAVILAAVQVAISKKKRISQPFFARRFPIKQCNFPCFQSCLEPKVAYNRPIILPAIFLFWLLTSSIAQWSAQAVASQFVGAFGTCSIPS